MNQAEIGRRLLGEMAMLFADSGLEVDYDFMSLVVIEGRIGDIPHPFYRWR